MPNPLGILTTHLVDEKELVETAYAALRTYFATHTIELRFKGDSLTIDFKEKPDDQ